MIRICPETKNETYCTEDCKSCAYVLYLELKKRTGNAEKVTKDAIIAEMGENEFNLMRYYGYIEHCHFDELGRHWYAI